jgi:hypothetical protein
LSKGEGFFRDGESKVTPPSRSADRSIRFDSIEGQEGSSNPKGNDEMRTCLFSAEGDNNKFLAFYVQVAGSSSALLLRGARMGDQAQHTHTLLSRLLAFVLGLLAGKVFFFLPPRRAKLQGESRPLT